MCLRSVGSSAPRGRGGGEGETEQEGAGEMLSIFGGWWCARYVEEEEEDARGRHKSILSSPLSPR